MTTCPKCEHESKVIDSRKNTLVRVGDAHAFPRRRECLSCGHRFGTYEIRQLDFRNYFKNQGFAREVADVIFEIALEKLKADVICKAKPPY